MGNIPAEKTKHMRQPCKGRQSLPWESQEAQKNDDSQTIKHSGGDFNINLFRNLQVSREEIKYLRLWWDIMNKEQGDKYSE